MSYATGDMEGIFDGLNRCVEALLYDGDLAKAESYLGKQLSLWSSVSDHSRAIAMKMRAKLMIARNKVAEADEIIHEGLEFSLSHRFHQQVYHFKRLQWNQLFKEASRRSRIIT
jgi:outer membrane PBP1 activator LpoA protein